MRDDSESDGDCGAGPARRARSVAPVGRRLLSTAGAALSISTSDLSGGGRPARAAPALCPQHRPPRVCQRPACDALHVCRLYVDGFCPHGDAACPWGHAVASDDNQAALETHQLQTLSERELLWLVRALLRQTAPVDAEEYRSQLAICAEYSADASCGRPDCFQLHLCPRLAVGGCRAGDSCRWSHRLTDPDNVMVLLRLRCAELSEAEVLARLAHRQDEDGLSDSCESERTLGDTDSERESTGTDGDLATLAAEGGAVGGACSPREASKTDVKAPGVTDLRKSREMGSGLTQNGATKRESSLGAADGSSGQGTGSSNGPGQAARAPNPGLQTATAHATAQQPRTGPVSKSPADKPATPDQPPAKELTKEEMIRVARTLDLCHDYGFPSKCLNKTCKKLHLCRFYVAGICTYAVYWCSRGHKFTDAHNKSLLAQLQLLKLSEAELVKALRAGYLARNPITGLERRFLVQVCRPFQRKDCKRSAVCTRVHICDGYLSGKCENSSACGLSHNLNSQHNAAVLRDLGLYSLKANDIRKILEQPVTAKDMWESVVPKQQRTASSGNSSSVVHTSGEQQPSTGAEMPAASPPSTAVSTDTAQAADASTSGSPPALAPAPAAAATPAPAPALAPAASSTPARETPAATPAGVSSVSSRAALAMAASASRDLSREEAKAQTAVSEDSQSAEGSQPAEGSQSAEGAGGAGTTVGRDGQSGHGSGDAGSGVDGAGQPREPAQQPVKSDKPQEPVQQTAKSDGAGQPAQQTPKSNGAGQSAQQTAKSNGVCQSAQPANPSQRTATKPPTAQLQPKSTPAPGKTPAKTLTKEEMLRVARTLDVCRDNFYPSKCKRKDCAKLHLCRFFIACKCTYAIYKCLRSHYLRSDPHNTRVLRNHQLEKLSEVDVFKALRDGYLAQNPVTDVERRFLVQMCRPYQRGFCKRTGVCTRVHICDNFILGKCDSTCGLSHNLSNIHNKGVVRDLGLDSLTIKDIREILENPVTAKEMWDSSAPKQQQQRTATSGPKQGVAASASTIAEKSPQNSGSSSQKPTKPSAAAVSSQPTESTSAAETPSSSQTDAVPAAGSGQPTQSTMPRAAAESDNAESQESVDSESDDSESDDSESYSDDSDLPDDGPALCAVHACGGRCERADCDGFHICGFYLANLCRRPDNQCPLGHSFSETHNVRMMDTYGLLGGSPEHFQELLDQMTLRARMTFSNEAEEKVSMCYPFNSPGGCASETCCGRFHLCNRFLAGTCTKADCELRHGLDDEHNGRVRELLGLAATPGGRHRHAWATDRDVIELIRAKLGVKPGVYVAPEVVESAGEETGSNADGAKLEGGKPDAKPAPASGETKSPPAEAALTAETTKAVSNGAKPGTNGAKPAAEPAVSARPAGGAGGSGGSGLAPQPAICASLCAGRRCADANCSAVHVCPHFLAGACRRQNCTLGHRLDTEPNRRALRLAGRAVTGLNQHALLKELYTAATNVRRSEVYAKLRICISHNHVGGCKSVGCPFIHICQRFASGKCEEELCAKGHSVETKGNKNKLRPLKLETAPVEEVLEMLRAVHGVRSVCK